MGFISPIGVPDSLEHKCYLNDHQNISKSEGYTRFGGPRGSISFPNFVTHIAFQTGVYQDVTTVASEQNKAS